MKLSLSPAAISAARRDLVPGQSLRIAFAGGCGAFGFRLHATARGDEDDLRLEVDAVPLLLDRMAARELDGARLEWNEDEGFVIDHPRWGTAC